MSVTVRIPVMLRQYSNGQSVIEVTATTLVECINGLEDIFPEMTMHLRNESGRIHSYLGFYVNNKDVRLHRGLDTKLQDGDEVMMLINIGGG